MRIRTLFIKALIPVMIFFSMSTAGCGSHKDQYSESKPQSMESEEKGDKVPEQLTGIEANIEKIFSQLKGPAAEPESTQEKAQGQGGNKETGGEEKKTGEEGESKENENKKNGEDTSKDSSQQGNSGESDKQKPEKQQTTQDPWTNIAPIINDLHYQWNNYMPMAAQKGAAKALMDNFSKALNSLTNTIIGKNSTNTLMAANYLYGYIPDFYSLYKTETSPEIKRIKYYTRNAMLNSWTGNWTQADFDINTLKSSWPIVKNTIGKDQQDSSNKLDYSLYELEKVIKEKNQPLIDIKGRVALSNIMAIEKGMQKSSESGISQ